jgi:hypothetical protein
MSEKLAALVSRVSDSLSVARRMERIPSVIRSFRTQWLVVVAVGWAMIGHGGIVSGQVSGVDDPFDMADSSGDIKRIEAWVDDGHLNLTMTVYGVFAPSVQETPAGMTNRYYYHWILDTDNNPITGFNNSEYEGNATRVKTPIGVDLVVQFGWRDGNTNGVYAYDPLTEDSLFEDYLYTIDGDTIHAVIPLEDLGLAPDDTIAVSAFQEGASNSWQVDWIDSAVLALTVVKASNPIPVSDSSDITHDVILGWDAGELAVEHTVYIGTNRADVNDASVGNPLGVLLGQGLADSSMDVGRLDFDQTYFWRVDEVNGAPDFTVFKGDVWSFTVEPQGIPIETITATASAANPNMGPENTINGSGLNDLGQHSALPNDMWLVAGADPWIQYDFGKPYKLHELLVWNSNQAIEAFIGFGVKEMTVEYTADGENWIALDGAIELAQASGLPTYEADNAIAFGGVMAQSVKLTLVSAFGTTGQSGLSEVCFLAIPVQAREPQPVDGGISAGLNVELTWRSGREAVQHEVYLGPDADNMILIGTADDAMAVTETLNFNTSYAWSVTEVNDAAIPTSHAGDIWTFTTPEFGVVDDFESYSWKEGQEVYGTWLDGYGGDALLGGSTTGHIGAPFVETSIVNSGQQSMPISIDNDGGFINIDGTVSSPIVSEVVREFNPAQDFTRGEARTLVLHFSGTPDNTGQLYLKINNHKITFDGDITQAQWQQWSIDLAPLAGLENVATLSVGVDGAGATGLLYIDDIRLYP